MKIVTVVGARPQFIKFAAVRRAVEAHNLSSSRPIHDVLIHTGQHYDANMSDVFFQQLGISKPDYHFEVGGTTHGAMTGKMLEQIEGVLIKERPDWVVIYGDTNSTMAGALTAAKMCIPLAHVEAGLRSFNRKMPEEINRIVADHCSNMLLTTHSGPTEQLLREGVSIDRICEVGDVMCDIARSYRERGCQGESWLKKSGLRPGDYVLVTIHRASNTDDPVRLQWIMDSLAEIANECLVVFPVHPRTRIAMERLPKSGALPTNFKLIDPVGYLEMLALENGAKLIITDSGGVQKEAYFCQVPCLIMRHETEWTELVEYGYSRLIGNDSESLLSACNEMLSKKFDWATNLYGDGQAAQKIIHALTKA